MLLNLVIACVVVQTFSLLWIGFNFSWMKNDFQRTADAFCGFISKFSIMNVGMLPEGIDDDFLQDMTSRLDADDDDETKQ